MERKIYKTLTDWKKNSAGKTALLVDGARRVGKRYIAAKFAKTAYKSYILIDFNILYDSAFINPAKDLQPSSWPPAARAANVYILTRQRYNVT